MDFPAAVAEVSVVGVSSHMIKDRDPVVAPGEQLKEAIELVTTSRPRDIRFTHTVRKFEELFCLASFHPPQLSCLV